MPTLDFEYTPIDSRTLPEEESSCSICQEKFASLEPNDTPVKLTCNHVFGKLCLVRWFTESRRRPVSCPLCRTQIRVTVLGALAELERSIPGRTIPPHLYRQTRTQLDDLTARTQYINRRAQVAGASLDRILTQVDSSNSQLSRSDARFDSINAGLENIILHSSGAHRIRHSASSATSASTTISTSTTSLSTSTSTSTLTSNSTSTPAPTPTSTSTSVANRFPNFSHLNHWPSSARRLSQ